MEESSAHAADIEVHSLDLREVEEVHVDVAGVRPSEVIQVEACGCRYSSRSPSAGPRRDSRDKGHVVHDRQAGRQARTFRGPEQHGLGRCTCHCGPGKAQPVHGRMRERVADGRRVKRLHASVRRSQKYECAQNRCQLSLLPLSLLSRSIAASTGSRSTSSQCRPPLHMPRTSRFCGSGAYVASTRCRTCGMRRVQRP